MCAGEQAPKSSKYDFSKIYVQNYKNQKNLGRVRRVRWVRWVRQLVEANNWMEGDSIVVHISNKLSLSYNFGAQQQESKAVLDFQACAH